jgi:hypothetical protein
MKEVDIYYKDLDLMRFNEDELADILTYEVVDLIGVRVSIPAKH